MSDKSLRHAIFNLFARMERGVGQDQVVAFWTDSIQHITGAHLSVENPVTQTIFLGCGHRRQIDIQHIHPCCAKPTQLPSRSGHTRSQSRAPACPCTHSRVNCCSSKAVPSSTRSNENTPGRLRRAKVSPQTEAVNSIQLPRAMPGSAAQAGNSGPCAWIALRHPRSWTGSHLDRVVSPYAPHGSPSGNASTVALPNRLPASWITD